MQASTNIHIEDALASSGVWVSTTTGTSMWPMLRDRRDTIVVRPCEGRLKKFDVALYRRDSAYVLHRVIDVNETGYRILGDNCIAAEDVPCNAVIGRLDEFWRGNKHCNPRSRAWLAYAYVWRGLWPLRRVAAKARTAAARIRTAAAKTRVTYKVRSAATKARATAHKVAKAMLK